MILTRLFNNQIVAVVGFSIHFPDRFDCILVVLEINEGILILHYNIPYWTDDFKHFLQIISSGLSIYACNVDLSEIILTSIITRRHATATSTSSRITSSPLSWWSWTSTLAWGRSTSSHPIWLIRRWSWIVSSTLIHTVTTVSFSLFFLVRFCSVLLQRNFTLCNLRVLVMVLFWLFSSLWWMRSLTHFLI